MNTVLTIAGSDCSGGAGIQADLKTMSAHNVYGMSAITALTAQNTTGVYGVLDAGAQFVARQLDCIFTDIVPDAVKIGMVSSREIIDVIVSKLTQYGAKNIVVDPVMVSTSGDKLMHSNAMQAVVTKLLPIATIITPNIPEAEAICNRAITSPEDMLQAAEAMSTQIPGAILLKGGHLTDTANDLLYYNGQAIWITGERIATTNTHGTGCTLSSAIACNLAQGLDLYQSVCNAKEYVTGALAAGLTLGKGNGPLNHCWNR